MKLWHDDVRRPPDGSWEWARTNEEARAILSRGGVDEASLDHDLGLHQHDPDEQDADLRIPDPGWGLEDGCDLVRWMIETGHVPDRITIHSWNPPGAKEMAALLRDYDGREVPQRPYIEQEAA